MHADMDMALDRIVPEDQAWLHIDEGPDDSLVISWIVIITIFFLTLS